VVGRFEKDEFTLEVHGSTPDRCCNPGRVHRSTYNEMGPIVSVYNQDEDSFYVHHDYTLSEPPICLEPIYFDPGSENKGALIECIIICMITYDIHSWDSLRKSVCCWDDFRSN